MTFDDVQAASTALRATGQTPSGNTVLTWMKDHGMKASKRTILRYLREGAGVPLPCPADETLMLAAVGAIPSPPLADAPLKD
jgi:hypothetical protein